MIFDLEHWSTFNDEKFTPTRFAESLLLKSKRYAELDMRYKAKRFADTAIAIL